MMNLMLCGNYKVFDGMLITLLSISKNTNEALNVYVITMDLTDENEVFKPVTQNDIDILENAIKQKNAERQPEDER